MSTSKLKSTSPSLKSTSPSLKSTSPSLISNWIKKHSKSRGGRLYFYNVVTGVSTWTKPDELIKDEARMKALDSESKKKPCLKRKANQHNSSPEKKQKSQNELSKKQSTISGCESNIPNKDPMLHLEQRLSKTPMKRSRHNTRVMDAQPKPELALAKSQPDVRNRKMIKPSKIKYINKSPIQQKESKNNTGLGDNKLAANMDTSGTFSQGGKNVTNTGTKQTVMSGTFSQGGKNVSNTGTKQTVMSGTFFQGGKNVSNTGTKQTVMSGTFSQGGKNVSNTSTKQTVMSGTFSQGGKNVSNTSTKQTVMSGTFSQGEKNVSNIKHTVTSLPDKASNGSYTSQKKAQKKASHNKQGTGGEGTVHKQGTGGTVHHQSERLQAEDDFIIPEKSISKNISSSQAKNILPIKTRPTPEKRDTSVACAHIFKSNRTHQNRINDNIVAAHTFLPQADILPFKRCASLARASKQINKVQGAGSLAVQNEKVSLGSGKPPSSHSRYDSEDTRHTKCSANTASIQSKEDYFQLCAKQQIENLATKKPQKEELFSSNQTYRDHLESANLNQQEIQDNPYCSGPPSDPTIGQQHNVRTHGSIPHKIVAENKIVSSNAVTDDHFESVNQPNNNISRFKLKTHKSPPGNYDSNSSEVQQSKNSIDKLLQMGIFPFKNQQFFEDGNEPHLATVCQAQDTTTVSQAQDATTVNEAQDTAAGENLSEDDYMDVDEEEILCNLQDVRNQTSNILEQPSGTLTEMVFNSKNNLSQASVVDSTSCPPIQAVVFVIDTNVLISNLQFFDNLLTTTVPGYGALRLVLPWAVMQELDYLKNGKSSVNNSSQPIAKKAADAVRRIHKYLSAHNSKLVGQTPHEASEPTNLPFHSNDDRILQCCLQCEKKYPSSMVMLVTRDINLINKAIIMGIKAANTDNFWSHFKVPRSKLTDSSKVISTSGELDQCQAVKNGSQENKIHCTINKCLSPFTPDSAGPGATHAAPSNTLLKQATSVTTVRPSPIGWTHEVKTSAPPTDNMKKHKEGSDISDSTKMEESQEVTGNDSGAFIKFQTVWSVIFDVKTQITDILRQGHLHENYSVAVEMLHTMLSLLMSLREDFESCLQLSPVVLTEHKFEFASLASQLNMFFERAKLSTPDPSLAVDTDQLIKHFTQGKNRSMLLTGLEQLAEFIQNYQDLSKMCASVKALPILSW